MGSPSSSRPDVTHLLRLWSQGDREALDDLVPLLYAELRQIAHQRLGRKHPTDR